MIIAFYLKQIGIKTALGLIKLYQKTISFDHGLFRFLYPYGYCKFQPSCSQYAAEAISARGLIKGGIMAVWRLLRCNPFSAGGMDPIKSAKNRQKTS
ncbi:membrane protein insertion efficiency factor YidD [Candidatus Uhrbacteria bacterium]|nr:membrane protein insertion efficiency factor YidD [Candidatus Uhrbacteria bacterium]